ncbi:MAG: YfhO family protein [Clostridia bacterium]|nr:YfhO family protein [Clostridia bacterium]
MHNPLNFLKRNKPVTEAMLLGQLERIEKRQRFFKTYGYLSLCAILPMVIMYLIYAIRGIHPFDDGAVLVLDLTGQYVWFFEALRNAVWGDASMLYSFARALGGEFLGIYAYYIASPLSYIVCLFPQDCMLEALLTLFLLKVGICGGTFGYYMHRTFKQKKPLAVITFSVFYALSAYAVVQQHNTMWIDALMWLPLITLGIEQLIKHGKFKMYTIFLALTVWSNFYIGYMVCIYCAIYFFLYYVIHAENPLRERFHFLKSFMRMAIYSVIALGIAAVVLLGAYYSLNFGKTTFSTTKWEFLTNFDLLDLFYKFLPGSYDTVRPEGLPFVYCGLLTLLFIPAYFFSKKYSIREKIVSGVLVIVFVIIATLNVTDLVMHGFQNPNWLNYRYSFMLCFILCVLACKALAEFESVSLKAMAGVAGIITLLCVILQKYTEGGEYVNPSDYKTVWFTLLLMYVYLSVLAILRTSNKKRLVAIALVAVVCAETLIAGLFNLNALDEDVGYSRYSYYNDFLDKMRPITERVKASDPSFYRMEKTIFRSTNDNMALELRGLSGSTSTLNKETIQFLNKMGYASKSHWSKYLGGTPVNDSLLGLKYIISDKDIYKNYYDVYMTDESTGYIAYRNPYALSIAYGVSDELLNFVMGYTNVAPNPDTAKDDESEVMEVEAVGSIVDTLKKYLNKFLDIEETVTTSEYVDKYNSPFERMNAIITAMLGTEETQQVFVPIHVDEENIDDGTLKSVPASDAKATYTRYEKKEQAEEGVLSFTLTTERDGELYFYLPSDYPREVKLGLFVHNSGQTNPTPLGSYYGNETHRIISLGNFKAGTKISLDLTLQKQYLYVMNNQDAFYYIDYEVFENAINTLKKDQLNVTEYTEDEIHGTFTASRPHETVLTTLAYDDGWKIYVDGTEVKTTKALGSLVAFAIDGEAGQTHTVDIVYKPHTYTVGVSVSIISGALLLLLIILEKRMKKIPVLRAIVSVVPSEEKNQVIEETEDSNEQSPTNGE